jgi:hypothetical protein
VKSLRRENWWLLDEARPTQLQKTPQPSRIH